ncbi:MAG: hypothetical protein KGZ25_15690, partial [Planctomycetes bacterium]|nr:hypothetical protein [Planctomycetota bacterium]
DLATEKDRGTEDGEGILGELEEDAGEDAEGWRTEKIDLWKVFGREHSMVTLRLHVNGGRILLDDLRLSRERK